MNRVIAGLLGVVMVFGAGCSGQSSNGKSNGKAREGGSATGQAKRSKEREPAGPQAKRLNGGGSSFVNPIMLKWASEYNKEHQVLVDYSSTGSGNGIQQMTAKTIDFGCTDAPMNEEQLTKARDKGGEVVHIPLVMGGVVVAYNLPDIKQPLKFSGEVLANIFLGKITRWNDAALKELNAGVELPDQEIGVIHRSDGSGTTYIFTDYLSKVSPEWKEKAGKNTIINWPTGVGQKGNEGVAGQVGRSPGTIGYVELLYALRNNISYGDVKNQDGAFVRPTLDSVTAAAKGGLSKIPDDLRYSLTDMPGKEAYPICGTTWAVLYVDQPEGKGEALVGFLRWVTHEGQEYCKDLQYAQLPTELVERVDKKLQSIHVGK